MKIFLIIVVGIIWWIISTRNDFYRLRETCKKRMSDIKTVQDQRNEAVANAMGILGVAHKNDVKAIKELNIEEQAKELKACVQKYPDLKDSPNYMIALGRIQNYTEEITAARSMLNNVLNDYNTSIGLLPKCYVASAFKFEPIEYIDEKNAVADYGVLDAKPVDFNSYLD